MDAASGSSGFCLDLGCRGVQRRKEFVPCLVHKPTEFQFLPHTSRHLESSTRCRDKGKQTSRRKLSAAGERATRLWKSQKSKKTGIVRVFSVAQLTHLVFNARDDIRRLDYAYLASSTPTSTLTWISWFCSLPGHEYFCEVTEDFIEDDFNLTGLNSMVPFWKEAMEMVLDVEPGTAPPYMFYFDAHRSRYASDEDAAKIPDVSIVESSAEMLYGLVHQRYILGRAGQQAMVGFIAHRPKC